MVTMISKYQLPKTTVPSIIDRYTYWLEQGNEKLDIYNGGCASFDAVKNHLI